MGYEDCPYQRRSTQPTKSFAYHSKFYKNWAGGVPAQTMNCMNCILKMVEF